MKKLVAEMIGTFALVFAGTGAIVINDVSHGGVSHVGIALTFGLVVLAMIYAVGDISGAHLNPAVGAVIGVEAMFAGKICGASMNPARSLAPALVSGHLAHLWVYVAGPLLGAMCAVFGCRACRESSSCPTPFGSRTV